MAAPRVKEAASLPWRLAYHSQSTLVDGRVLVSGGSSGWVAGKKSEVQLYVPTTNSWSGAAPMPQPRDGHAQTTLAGGLVLVCGGYTGQVSCSDAQVYDPTSNRWTAVAPMKTPRRHHSASTLADGRALVCGGWTTGEKRIAEVEIYDPRSNTWTQAAPMPVPMCTHTQSTLNDRRVLVCGQDAKKVPTVCTYNPETDQWTAAALPKGLVGTVCASQTTLADGRVLVAGGRVDAKWSRTSALYTPTTGIWVRGPDLPSALSRHAASLLHSGDVLVSGGSTPLYQSRVTIIHIDPGHPPSGTQSNAQPDAVAMVTTIPTHPNGGSGVSGARARAPPSTIPSNANAEGRGSTTSRGEPYRAATASTGPRGQPPRPTNPVNAEIVAKDRENARLAEELRRTKEEKEAAAIETTRRLEVAEAARTEANSKAVQAEARVAETERANRALQEQASQSAAALAEAHAREIARAAASVIAANADAAEAVGTAAVETLRSHIAASPRFSLELFKITARIGERSRPTAFHQFYGVNSAVFEAVLDGRVVVIKVVYNVEQITDSNLSDTFKTDYALIEDPNKSHPNILAGLGHFVGEASQRTLGDVWDANPEYVRLNTLFIVMEPMERPLKKLISDLGNGTAATAWPPVMPLAVFKVVMQRVLRALVELFRLGIVHRDLKADNVLINYKPAAAEAAESQPTVLVKLADFGHSLDTTAHRSIVNFKMPYLVDGMPKGGAAAYLAPEVVNTKAGTFDDPVVIDYSKNDVFAAGMLAHYMLTNGVEDAFATRDPEYTAVHHPHYSAATYNHLPPECPKPIADLVWAMVNPSFEQRITAEEALARVDAMIYVSDIWG